MLESYERTHFPNSLHFYAGQTKHLTADLRLCLLNSAVGEFCFAHLTEICFLTLTAQANYLGQRQANDCLSC